jgi:hypothetical protein
MKALQRKIQKITDTADRLEHQQQAERWRRARTRAGSASRTEIDTFCKKITSMCEQERSAYLKTVDDHLLLVMRDHLEDYTRRAAAAMPPEQVAQLVRRYKAAPNGSDFLGKLTDIELQALIENCGPEDDGVDYDAMSEDELDELINDDTTEERAAAILDKYRKPQEG